MTRAQAARAAAAALEAARIDTPELDARALALEAFGMSLARLLSEGGAEACAEERARLDRMVARRAAGEPVDRILGRREFWGLPFSLAPETLSPRPDTETVVEAALAAFGGRSGAPRLLDLGVGSGCILLALLSELPGATGIGVDRSCGAAAAARKNAEALGLGDRARFVVGDWAAAIDGRFDLVVSNPPYIESREIAGLEAEVRDHDPHLALDGGADGLDAYRTIVGEAARLLAPGGAMVLELGCGQEAAVGAIARACGLDVAGEARDLGGVIRAMTLRPGSAAA